LCFLFLVSCSGDSPVGTYPPTQSDLVWKDLRTVPSYGRLDDVWGDAAGNVFAVGNAALRFDGEVWTCDKTGLEARRVWGTSADNVYAARYQPLHFDGSVWSELDLGTDESFYSVHGSSPVDVYFTGTNGTVIHYDGTESRLIDAGVTTYVLDVWSNGSDDVYLVSEDIVHFDGTAWETVDTGDPEIRRNLRCVASAGPDNVLVSGKKTTFFDGTTWTTIPHEDSFNILWCNGPNDYYAAQGFKVMRFDGQAWSVFFELPADRRTYLNSVWGDPQSAMYAVGWHGEIWLYRRGELECLNQTTDGVVALWAERNNDVHIATSQGGLFRFDGHTWEKQGFRMASGGPKSIWGSDNDNVFAVDGRDLFHFNGDEWNQLELERQIYPTDVWQAYDGTVFVVGDEGIAIRKNLRWWYLVGGPSLDSVWGRNSHDVYAASGDGTLLHYDGDDWSVVPHEMRNIYDLWGCDGRIYAAGITGLWICREEKWTPAPGSPRHLVKAMWGTSASNILLLGSVDRIYHYDGTVYEEVHNAYPDRLFTIWGVSASSIYVGGDYGLLLHYGPYGD
jgi:hypothetical protein